MVSEILVSSRRLSERAGAERGRCRVKQLVVGDIVKRRMLDTFKKFATQSEGNMS